MRILLDQIFVSSNQKAIKRIDVLNKEVHIKNIKIAVLYQKLE